MNKKSINKTAFENAQATAVECAVVFSTLLDLTVEDDLVEAIERIEPHAWNRWCEELRPALGQLSFVAPGLCSFGRAIGPCWHLTSVRALRFLLDDMARSLGFYGTGWYAKAEDGEDTFDREALAAEMRRRPRAVAAFQDRYRSEYDTSHTLVDRIAIESSQAMKNARV